MMKPVDALRVIQELYPDEGIVCLAMQPNGDWWPFKARPVIRRCGNGLRIFEDRDASYQMVRIAPMTGIELADNWEESITTLDPPKTYTDAAGNVYELRESNL